MLTYAISDIHGMLGLFNQATNWISNEQGSLNVYKFELGNPAPLTIKSFPNGG